MIEIIAMFGVTDYPYMMGGVEIPPAGQVQVPYQSSYTYTYDKDMQSLSRVDLVDAAYTEKMRPRHRQNFKEGTFEVEIPNSKGSYVSLSKVQYVCVWFDDNLSKFKIYGWVTDVRTAAASRENIIFTVAIDPWRTYKDSLSYGRGVITKCKNSAYRRPYNVHPRFQKAGISTIDSILSIQYDDTLPAELWAIVRYDYNDTYQHDGNDVTRTLIGTAYWPLKTRRMYKNALVTDFLSFAETFNGYVEDMIKTALGSDVTILSAYVSPIPPDPNITYDADNDYWELNGNASELHADNNNNHFCTIKPGALTVNHGFVIDLGDTITADDTASYAITDLLGNPVYNLPWGTSVRYIACTNDTSELGGYAKLILFGSTLPHYPYKLPPRPYNNQSVYDNSEAQIRNLDAGAAGSVGLICQIPLPLIPIDSNAASSYVYSGQRDYDIEKMRIAREEQLAQGKSNALTSAVGGALTGALVGGGIGAVAGTGITYGISLWQANEQYRRQGVYNDRLQEATDRLYAQQSNGITIPGGSWTFYNTGTQIAADPSGLEARIGIKIIKMEPDATSKAEYLSDITINGYDVQIPASSCGSFISAGGPLRIEGLKVIGADIPVPALQEIRAMFARGVYIN